MINLKKYDEYQKVDENLGRYILGIPIVIFGEIFGALLGIDPLIKYKWRELKEKTKDSSYKSPVFPDEINIKKMESDLTKISKNDIIAKKLKLVTFFSEWNVFSSNNVDEKTGRPIIYLSKDDFKMGDLYSQCELSDRRIYNKEFFNKFSPANPKPISERIKDPKNMPIFIIIVKYDGVDKARDIEDYINDICIDLQDDGHRIETTITPTIDKISIKISIKNMKYSDDNPLIEEINDITLRINHYLNMEGIYYNYKILYRCLNSIFYCGTAGRFIPRAYDGEIIPGIIDAAKKIDYENSVNYSSGLSEFQQRICYKLHTDSSIKNPYEKYQGDGVYLSGLRGQNDDLVLTASDIKAVLSDPKHCYLSHIKPINSEHKPIDPSKLELTIGEYIIVEFKRD